MTTVWRDVAGYAGLYSVSNVGDVRSRRKVLKPGIGERPEKSCHYEKGNNMITVYSTPKCTICRVLTGYLDKHGVDYRKIDLSEDEGAMKLILRLGHKQAPVVIADMPHGEEVWQGMRMEKLAAAVEFNKPKVNV